MPNNDIYTKSYCPYCSRAKSILDKFGVEYSEIEVSNDRSLFEEMVRRSGRQTVPQIHINGTHIGGSDDLYEATQTGLLKKLLNDCESPN